MRRGRTWPWIRMRPFLAQFSEPVWSGHLPSWADFITTTSGFRFSVHTMVGMAMPPKADNPGLDPNFLGDRPGAAPGRRQQNYPRPLQIALQGHRGATARLKHLAIFPRKVDFSCFG